MSGDIEEGVAVAEERRASKDAGDEAIVPAPTDPDTGLTTSQVEKALEKYGLNEIPAPVTPLYMLFLYQFSGFLPFLIEVAAIVSLGVQDYVDFGIITAILVINACLGFREEYHAKKSLDELSSSLESEIAVRRNGEVVQISTTQLVPGDIILLVGGTVVPADTQWIRGDAMQIDTAALTGEPIPRKYPSTEYGDVIWSGTTVVAGECYGQVMATGLKTEIGRAQADILKDKSVRIVSVFQAKIMVVVQILVSSCLAIVLAVLLVQRFVYDSSVSDSILDALSILIASIPVALPLVLQLNLALGASFLAKEHSAIVTSIPALQDIASMSMLCSDKTGTLTTANMSIITDRIYAADGFTAEETLLYAYLCSNADKKDDPIDRAIVNAFRESEVKQKESEYKQTEIIGFNPSVKRVVAFAKHGDCMITVAKGLPAKIIDTAAVSVDDHELQWKVDTYNDKSFIQQVTETDRSLSSSGYKTIGIAVCEGNARELENPVWKFVGLVPMLDPPRKDTAATIASLHHANISVKMITGDHVNVGIETARLIGLGTNIHYGEEVRNAEAQAKKELIWEADGFAAVLPSDKREVVLTLRNEYGVVTGMTGDGVNGTFNSKDDASSILLL
jgi:H+-transporting ATPase